MNSGEGGAMQFLMAILFYILATVIIAWGILLALKGSFWVLGIATLLYLVAFTKYGCADH